jgi:hypothetical protein
MRVILQLAYAAVVIAGLVAIQVAVLYALGCGVGRLPLRPDDRPEPGRRRLNDGYRG